MENGIAQLASEVGKFNGGSTVGPGFTDAAKRYILALFENAAYKNDTMQATYAALKAEWGMGSGTIVTVTTLLDCFSDITNDQRGIIVSTWTNGTVGMNMFTYGSHFVKIESGKKLKFLLQIKGTQFRFLSYGSLTEWKNIPNYAANKTVDRSLILGASWTASSGETTDGKARFFNGTVYDFQVFDTALTDAQITTLMEAN